MHSEWWKRSQRFMQVDRWQYRQHCAALLWELDPPTPRKFNQAKQRFCSAVLAKKRTAVHGRPTAAGRAGWPANLSPMSVWPHTNFKRVWNRAIVLASSAWRSSWDRTNFYRVSEAFSPLSPSRENEWSHFEDITNDFKELRTIENPSGKCTIFVFDYDDGFILWSSSLNRYVS